MTNSTISEARLRVLLDECVDHRVVRVLRDRGYDVLTVQSARTRRDSDESQLLLATLDRRLMVSHNQIDFRRLHLQFVATGRKHGGIITIPQTVPPARLEMRLVLLLEWVAAQAVRQSRLFRWTDLQQLLITGYRPPESTCSEDDVRNSLGR